MNVNSLFSVYKNLDIPFELELVVDQSHNSMDDFLVVVHFGNNIPSVILYYNKNMIITNATNLSEDYYFDQEYVITEGDLDENIFDDRHPICRCRVLDESPYFNIDSPVIIENWSRLVENYLTP